MTDSAALARELAELDKVATPRPWQSLRDGNQYVDTAYIPTAKLVGASRIDGVLRPWNPHAVIARGITSADHEVVRFIDGDADLVAALRNNLPAILRALCAQAAVEECRGGPTPLVTVLDARADELLAELGSKNA